MKRARVLSLVVLLAGVACREKKSRPPPPPPPAPVASPEPVKATPGYNAAAVTSLLRLPARLAVSSLESPTWIAVRLPPGDRVTGFKLPASFLGKTIAITHEGQLRQLKVISRSIAFDGSGGEYKLEPVEKMAGRIEGFDVVGVPGKREGSARRAEVRVGSLLAPEHYLADETAGLDDPGPYATLDEYCAKLDKDTCSFKSRTPTVAEVRVEGKATIMTYVAMQTSRGWFPQAFELRRDLVVTGFMNPEVTLEALSLEHPANADPFLTLVVYQREWGPIFNGEVDGGQVLVASTARSVTPLYVRDGYPEAGEALTLSAWHGEYKDMQDGPRNGFRVQADGGLLLTTRSAEAGPNW